MNNSNFITALYGFTGAIIGGLVVGTMFHLLNRPAPPKKDSPNHLIQNSSQPGMQLVSAFGCKPGETKHIYVRGAEDNYSLLGDEKSRTHDRLKVLPGLTIVSGQLRDYDEAGSNKTLSDYFELPPNISDGLFVSRMKSHANSTNDNFNIGDYLNRDTEVANVTRHMLTTRIAKLSDKKGWTNQGDLYSVRLSDIIFETKNQFPERHFKTLLEYVQNQPELAVVDLAISDDTMVDFSAITVCERPYGDRGVTLTTHTSATIKSPDITALTCNADVTQATCNPYYGDTRCDQELPLACFNDLASPFPEDQQVNIRFLDKWSGGAVAFSEKVKGNSFKTIQDANEFCVAQFGENWRVVSWHDGGSSDVLAFNHLKTAQGRAWVDIGDQPDATCWIRDFQPGDNHAGHEH